MASLLVVKKNPKTTPKTFPVGWNAFVPFGFPHGTSFFDASLVVPLFLFFMESDGSSGGTRMLSAFTGLEMLFALFCCS